MANEAKQFTIGGVTHDVMDVGARQLIADLQAAIDAITSGDTTTAIKTFQEVINFLDGVTDDATLIGKLNELRTLINAKYTKPASGIPASDLAEGVIPDVSGFATKTEVNAKANSDDVYSKSEVDGKVADAGKVKSVTINGQKKFPNEQTGDVDLGTVQGEKGDKGDTGNVEITDASEIVTIIQNNLDSSNGNDILSARQGKILKHVINTLNGNIQALFNALANLAFTGNKPTLEALDWTGGTFYSDFTLHLTGVTATDNTTNGQLAEESTYRLEFTAMHGYTLNGATIQVTNRGKTVQYTLNNNVLEIADVIGSYDITISAVANFFTVQLPDNVEHLSIEDSQGNALSGQQVIEKSGSLEFECYLKADFLYSAAVQITMGNVDVTSTAYTPNSGRVYIQQLTGDVVISATMSSHNPLFKNVRMPMASAGYNKMYVLTADTDSSDGFMSPLIQLGTNTKVTFSTGLNYKDVFILFFDANGEYLQSFRQNGDPRTVDIPSGATYARLTSTSDSFTNCYFTGNDTEVKLWDGSSESLTEAAGARVFLESVFGAKTDAYGSILHAQINNGIRYNDGPLANEHLEYPDTVVTREITLPEIGSDGDRKLSFWSGQSGSVFMIYDGNGNTYQFTQQGDSTTGRELNVVGDYAIVKYARMMVPITSYYDYANNPLWVKDSQGNVLWSNEGITAPATEEEGNGND